MKQTWITIQTNLYLHPNPPQKKHYNFPLGIASKSVVNQKNARIGLPESWKIINIHIGPSVGDPSWKDCLGLRYRRGDSASRLKPSEKTSISLGSFPMILRVDPLVRRTLLWRQSCSICFAHKTVFGAWFNMNCCLTKFFEFKNGEHHSKDWCIKTKKICMPYWNGGHLVIYSSTTDGWTPLGASLGLPGYTFPGFNKSLTWAQPYWSDSTTLNIAYTAYIREARWQLENHLQRHHCKERLL